MLRITADDSRMDAVTSFLSPEVAATYEIVEKLGEGGMGAVYKVRHRVFGEICVIKVMQAKLQDNPQLRERFEGEARKGKQLDNRHIAKVVTFFIGSNGNPHLVMEYVEGVDLRKIMARVGGALDPKTVSTIGIQALDALGCLHEKKLIHRDISPENLMLTENDDGTFWVKLIDLGIVKSLDEPTPLTHVGAFIGKVAYASPEQFGGVIDARSDLYSLGIVLYELATGVRPITAANNGAYALAHYKTPPRPFAETDPTGRVPELLRRVILRSLEKAPEHRYQSAGEFAAELRASHVSGESPTIVIAEISKPASMGTLPATTMPMTSPAAMPANHAGLAEPALPAIAGQPAGGGRSSIPPSSGTPSATQPWGIHFRFFIIVFAMAGAVIWYNLRKPEKSAPDPRHETATHDPSVIETSLSDTIHTNTTMTVTGLLTTDVEKQIETIVRGAGRDGLPDSVTRQRVADLMAASALPANAATPVVEGLNGRLKRAGDAISEGKQRIAKGDLSSAYASFQAATDIDPRNPDAWSNLGAAAALLGISDKARDAYEMALRLDDKNWLAHYNIACQLVRNGDKAEALTHIQQAIALMKQQTRSPATVRATLTSIRSDEALGSLRQDPRFRDLLAD
jgi:serine/threonine protein kinase